MNMDLNIDHYDLDDLLALFKIPIHFDESDLKRAKQTVLKIHPDKSGLHADYFRFYSKAYKAIYGIWEFRKKGDVGKDSTTKNTEYATEMDESKRELLNQFFDKNGNKNATNLNPSKDFNAWFNKQFDKAQIKSECEEKGYESWLRSGADDEQTSSSSSSMSIADMHTSFGIQKEKARERALVMYNGFDDTCSSSSVGGYGDLSTDAPSCFDSDLFSTLPYQDLQKAHDDSVIPITDTDFETRERFKNVNDIMMHRDKQEQDVKPLFGQQAVEYLSNRNKYNDEASIRTAYQLAKQTEMAVKKQSDFWTSMHLLAEK